MPHLKQRRKGFALPPHAPRPDSRPARKAAVDLPEMMHRLPHQRPHRGGAQRQLALVQGGRQAVQLGVGVGAQAGQGEERRLGQPGGALAWVFNCWGGG